MQNTPKRSYAKYLMGGTGMAMLVAFAAPVAVQAQDAADDMTEVVVIGARAAQQSSNNRKRTAKTAVDSIVADDVGAFPDRNINEAISRMAGVALSRDDFGEGTEIHIRGNSQENIRVEMDGMGVGGGGMGATRSADLTSLPADLIKSVDVVKGSTADMTEGSLGGGVRIQTRTGLDFAKPYLSFRVGARRNSLGQEWQPDYNLIASRKFFDDRLGVVFSLTQTKYQNNTSSVGVNASGAGYQGRIDFDNSPEKTFAFNPSTVDLTNPASTTLLGNSSFTPQQIVEMSASAQTKQECYDAFPVLTAGSGVNQSTNAARRNQRVYELQTCLGQWNDLEPQNVRSFDNTQYEDRLTADIRFDFRVNDRLTVFAKYTKNDRKVDRYYRNRSLSGGLQTPMNPGNIYSATANPNGVWYVDNSDPTRQERAVAPGNTDYFLYDGVGVYGNLPIYGDVLGIDPSTVKVDANHFVTEYVMNGATMGLQQRWEPFTWDSSYVQTGGTYRDGGLTVEFMAGKSQTDYSRISAFSTRGITYGSARFFVEPSGLWAHEILTPYDETDPNNYVQMVSQAAFAEQVGSVDAPYIRPYSVAERPLVTANSANLQYDAWLSETEETTAKLDVTYNFKETVPFITTVKAGVSFRNPKGSFWSNPGGKVVRSAQGTYHLMEPDPNYTGTGTAPQVPVRDANGLPVLNPDYVSPIVLPRVAVRSSIRACEPTATSIESCNFGYNPSTILRQKREGVLTLTPDALRDLFASTVTRPDSVFFNDYEGAESLTNWPGIDTRTLVGLLPTANFDCVKSCVASDGNVYEQPFTQYDEKMTAAYYMVEFEQELPFNFIFNGNVGLRAIETDVSGRGELVLNYVRTTAAFDPLNPTAAAGIQTTTYTQNVTVSKKTRDYLPSYNLNLWVLPDQLVLRYYKGKNISRPSVAQLLPAGTCEIDERRNQGIEGFEEDQRCSGRIGNPALKPFTAWNQNLSVEWYPNRDTMVSLAVHEQVERIGNRTNITETRNMFEGSDFVDPVTGERLDNVAFSIPTFGNAPGFKRKGWEFTSKTAFTFLPWYLRYTGADFNYSKLESTLIGGTGSALINPNTGEVMPPMGESPYFANLSLWYDDGKTNARISYQARGEYFINIEGNSGNVRNNYPFAGGTNTRPTPYRPGNAIYRDETKFIDAKITHKLTPSVEIFGEVRNLTKEGRIESNGGAFGFADGTPYINTLDYGGRHFSFGVTYRQR